MVDINQNDLKAMQTLIRLVSAGARKEDVSSLSVDWNTVLPLATEQQVIPLVACALLYSPGMACPDQLREYLLDVMRAESSANLIRRHRIMHLIAELEAAGISVKVLKGYAIAGCYAHPECRGSVDTDLLIECRQEQQAVQLMEEHDFQVDPRAATSNHTVCQHRKYGMVELHVSLYGELIRNNWFRALDTKDMVQEPDAVVDSFHTLGPTDQLIFLTLHMVKHFILEGLTLRMMLDIALYFSSHKQEIDVVRYWSTLKALRYDELMNCILWTMVHFGGFSTVEFSELSEVQPEKMDLVLSDLIQGGYMGVKEKAERLESGMEYNRQLIRKQKSELQYRLCMIYWKIKSGTKYMFPSVKMLRKLYPITSHKPFMMPFFWVLQVVLFPAQKIRSGALKRDVRSENCTVTRITENRIAMFRKLGMI